jgi:hypothetical protein
MNEENLKSQEDLTPSTEVDGTDYKALYFDEIQNAKKQRSRAQEAEAQIQSYQKKQERSKMKSLEEQEKYKELSETLKTQLDDALQYKEKYQTWEATEREELLSVLPEQDREGLQNESMQSLRYIAKQFTQNKPSIPEASLGIARNMNLEKPYGEMTDDEKRAYYEQTLQQRNKR